MQQLIYLELIEDGKRLTVDGDLGLLSQLVRTFDREPEKVAGADTKEKPAQLPAGAQGGNHDQ